MSMGTIIGGLLFSGVGLVVFNYGRKQSLWKPMAIGAALMVFPYFVWNAWALWMVGSALMAALWFFRD